MIVEQLNFIVMKRNTLFSFFLVLFLIFSCEKDNEIISDPQYSIWEENKFEDYDFTLQISCFCIIEYTMPKRIEVRDNKVVSVEGTPFEDLNDISYRTIDGFFELRRTFLISIYTLSFDNSERIFCSHFWTY